MFAEIKSPRIFVYALRAKKKYGMDRSKWEKWLVYMVADLDREYKQEIDVSKNEDIFTDLEFDVRLEDIYDE